MNSGLARAMDEHVRRILQSADDILEHIKLEYEEEGRLTEHLTAFVQKKRSDPSYNQLAIANSDGTLSLVRSR